MTLVDEAPETTIRELVYEPDPPVLAPNGIDTGVDPDLGF